MEHLLIFNLAVDEDDTVLGFTSAWIRALAQKAKSVCVITMRTGRFNLPNNVQVCSVGKEKGYNDIQRTFEFYRCLFKVLRTQNITACFSHMMPLFSAMAGPILRAYHIPLVTWYAHPQLTGTLKLAHYMSNRMVASVATAYPYHHDKLTVIGQGIDTELFSPGEATYSNEQAIILCAGRISRVKDHMTLIKAVALLKERMKKPFQIVILGDPLGIDGQVYKAELENQITTLGLESIVRFEPGVTATALVDWYRRCKVHVNLTPTGFGDKVAWEAMSCGCPCLVANEGFRETLGELADQLLFPYQDFVSLAEKLIWILDVDECTQLTIGDKLRSEVIKQHSIFSLSERLSQAFLVI